MRIVTVNTTFSIERRRPDEFNLAQLWLEIALKLRELEISEQRVKKIAIAAHDMSYEVVVSFELLADTENLRGLYGTND